MNRLKKPVSIIIAAMMALTMIPMTEKEVSALEAYSLDKIALTMGAGELLVPGYDEELPGTINVSFDRSACGPNVQKAIDNKRIAVDMACWQEKDSTDPTGWTNINGPVAEGDTYRMAITITTDVGNTQDDFYFDSTKLFVDGKEWKCAEENFIYATYAGPEYTVTESSKSEFKAEAPKPTNTNTPTPTNTVAPTNTNTPAPTNTNTPVPTNTNTPVPTQAVAQPTQTAADPTTQPAAQGGTSDKIKGAPKNLECEVSKGDKRTVEVSFTPDLECGIDQSCGVVIAASTDNKATWQVVDSWSFTGGNKDLKWNTKALSGAASFKMDLEKEYYVKAYYVESDGKKGPDSNICGPFGPVEDESKIPGKIEAASTSAVKATGIDTGLLKKGTTATFERDFYKLTLTVKEIKGSDVTFAVKLEPKEPYGTYLFMEYGNIRCTDKYGKSHGEFFMNDEATINMADMAVGCNQLLIPVTCTVRNTYDRNQKKYKFEEYIYFDAAPQSPSLSVSKADTKSITLGKAYSNKINCTDSGTTVYYRKKGAKSWKSKTFAKGKAMKITGLSASSVYQFKAVDFVKSKDRNGKVKTISSNDSKEFIFRTANKTGPAIKSAKTSKVSQKTKKFNGQWVKSGIHWKWQKSFTSKATIFKLSIKLKSKTPAAGLILVDPDGVGHLIKGTKDTFNLSTEIKGYKKGKTVKFKVATFGNGDKVDNITAISPYKTISVTIK